MKKYFLSIVLLVLSAGESLVHAQQVITEKKDTAWHHFRKIQFKLNGIPAWYVEPRQPLEGNPWVWRAHFPNWHTAMDSMLLERGFHIAYINTNNLFGHPQAMNVWDDFYDYLVQQKKFARKVALEGVSRGGLYIYNWAKRNPGNISCIYAEAPVCDFKSWPGGKGRGKGSPDDWQKLLVLYHFTEADALKYNDQPKDNLETLAAFKVPLLHVVGANDSIVPNDENTLQLVSNYKRLGGQATVLTMTKGESLSGHHFTIENPGAMADFIYQYSVPVVRPLAAAHFISQYGRLDNFLYKVKHDKKATVAFLGGSITNMKGWRDQVMLYLTTHYPATVFTFLNAGIPSLGSVPHAFRLQADVLSKGKPDLLFIESAVNDHVNGTSETQQRNALEGIVRQAYAANPEINMVLMAFADETKTADYKTGKIPVEIRVHDAIAKYYRIPFINLAEEICKRMDADEFSWEKDFKNLHPSPFGQALYANAIKTLLRLQAAEFNMTDPYSFLLPAPLQKTNYDAGKYKPVTTAGNLNSFAVKENWKPSDDAGTRPGFVNLPVLEGTTAGASFDFSFAGTAVGIAVVSGPDAGTINYTIDDGKEQSLVLYTQWSKQLHLPWYLVLGDGLKNGKHILKLKIANEKPSDSKGTACRIVNFLVN